jgi:hypothetical protein
LLQRFEKKGEAMNKLIRDIPDEAVEELDRQAKEIGLKFGTYARLLLIHAAVRKDTSTIQEWAAKRFAHPREQQEGSSPLTERDRYQLAVESGTTESYHDHLRREAFRRDELIHQSPQEEKE